MKKATTKEDLLSDEEGPDYLQLLKKELKNAQTLIMGNKRYSADSNRWQVSRNTEQANYREDKIFTLFTADSQTHLFTHWSHIQKLYPMHKAGVVKLTKARIKAVVKDLLRDVIKIEERPPLLPYSYEQETKNERLEILKQQADQLRKKLGSIDTTLREGEVAANQHSESKDLFSHLYSEQKLKETELWIQQKQQQKQARRKILEQQRKKQQQQLLNLQKQEKEAEEKRIKEAKEEFIKRQLQLRKKRQQQKQIRQRRNSEYLNVKQQMKQKPRLFQRLLKSYSEKRQFEQVQRRHQLRNERKARYKNIDELKIEQHEKQYQELKRQKDEDRQKKLQQYLQNQQKSRVRYHSSLELGQRKPDKSELEKQVAKQKASKMKEYEMIVKEKYQPKIDQAKKKQMETLIQEADLNSRKKMKKVVLEDGKILYEEIKELDPRMLGIQYLEMTKQMAARARSIRGKGGAEDIKSSVETAPVSKSIDYLELRRKNPRPKPAKLSFINKSNLTFDEKLQKVLVESEKLTSHAKINEDRLKYGKFKTSDEILDCKEQIDQSYIDMAFMKLQMIKDGNK